MRLKSQQNNRAVAAEKEVENPNSNYSDYVKKKYRKGE